MHPYALCQHFLLNPIKFKMPKWQLDCSCLGMQCHFLIILNLWSGQVYSFGRVSIIKKHVWTFCVNKLCGWVPSFSKTLFSEVFPHSVPAPQAWGSLSECTRHFSVELIIAVTESDASLGLGTSSTEEEPFA